MKKAFHLLLVLSLMVFLSGCSLLKDTPLEGWGTVIAKPLNAVFGQHPERPLQDFLEAMHGKNYSKATTYLTEVGRKFYPEKNMKNFEVGTGFKVQAVEISDKDKNIARVYYSQKDSAGQLALMKKVEGAWKVEEFGDDENDRFD